MKRAVDTKVLNGFLTQAISHNKYLEETEMWKKHKSQNEEKKPKTHDFAHKKSSSTRKKKSRSTKTDSEADEAVNEPKKLESDEEIDDLQVLLALYKDIHHKPVEKWDHSGFNELYPDNDAQKLTPKPLKRLHDSDTDSARSLSSLPDSKKKKSKHKSSKHKKSHSKPKKRKKKKDKD